jgi:hypothetical protein
MSTTPRMHGITPHPPRKKGLGAARVKAASEAELAWFFKVGSGLVAPAAGGQPSGSDAARAIAGWLDQLPAFHRGALSFHYTPRKWSPLVQARFKEWTSLVVRLDCATHPSDGTKKVEVLEAEAVARLEASIVLGHDKAELGRLREHAKHHVRAALLAYAEVRGAGPCVLRNDTKGGA